jgi:hypothetical protein
MESPEFCSGLFFVLLYNKMEEMLFWSAKIDVSVGSNAVNTPPYLTVLTRPLHKMNQENVVHKMLLRFPVSEY